MKIKINKVPKAPFIVGGVVCINQLLKHKVAQPTQSSSKTLAN